MTTGFSGRRRRFGSFVPRPRWLIFSWIFGILLGPGGGYGGLTVMS